jgi:hypothetical protein
MPPVPPVPLLLLLEFVLELLLEVLVELWAPPLPPPLPPPPGILDRSTAAMSSHPVVVAARVVAATRKAIKRLDVLFMLGSLGVEATALGTRSSLGLP